jgi:hypothetical protein
MAYQSTSPYFTTPVTGEYLGLMVNRGIPKFADDIRFTINETYNLRPDLLAYDLYGTPNLWWVFAQRNPNSLTDPLLDFVIGTNIYLPKKSTLKSVLGF